MDNKNSISEEPEMLEEENDSTTTEEKQTEKTGDVLQEQEKKLVSKYPSLGNKPAASKLLQKRLSKGRVFFDSGEYSMNKVKELRASSKVVSKTPTHLKTDSSGEDSHGEKDSADEEEDDDELGALPDPSKQAIPTPELLFLRRASLHMPKNTSERMIPDASSLGRRRATMQVQNKLGGLPGLNADPADLFAEDDAVPDPKMLARRRATLQVTSKLAI